MCGGVINLRPTQRAHCAGVACRSDADADAYMLPPAELPNIPPAQRFHINKTPDEENVSRGLTKEHKLERVKKETYTRLQS